MGPTSAQSPLRAPAGFGWVAGFQDFILVLGLGRGGGVAGFQDFILGLGGRTRPRTAVHENPEILVTTLCIIEGNGAAGAP